ncbi:hypothetical protein PO878_15305 [Iamia majanohamensis]|uniref:Lipoprotein n=1 Tax=Iamia majanohamensis TaxID=467976 RepID=A0AAE9Y458_9ACTN|nr:hypothetical protein [Iamia majanohamensis]WCO65869.1 hypothetical protein PO878_15305 [Iamia majanohamensis]
MLRRLPLAAVALVLASCLSACGFALDTKSDQPATTIPPAPGGVAAPGPAGPTTAPEAEPFETTTTLAPGPPWCRDASEVFAVGEAAFASRELARTQQLFLVLVDTLDAIAAQAPDDLERAAADLRAAATPVAESLETATDQAAIDPVLASFVDDHEAEVEALRTVAEASCR